MNYSRTLINAILAGIFIGIAGTVYLSIPQPVTGALFFGFGLLTIINFKFKLFTGAIGYFATVTRATLVSRIIELIIIWAGNVAGCYLVGTLIRNSRSFAAISARVANICAIKNADSPASWLILSFFCGILMYTAVETSGRQQLAPVYRVAAVFLCVAVFILSGFEHCIANMYYYTAAGAWNSTAFAAIAVMTLGNTLGGLLLPVCGHLQKAE